MELGSWRSRPGSLPNRLSAELREAIAVGRILPGSALPSERRLATEAGVSRTTAGAALDVLVASGWAERRRQARTVACLPHTDVQPLSPVSPNTHDDLLLDLGTARIAAPAALLNDAIDRARSQLPTYLLGDGRVRFGLGKLREAIAEEFTSEGLQTHPDHILVTNGAMGAFGAVLDATPGRVMVEDPTYQVALQILLNRRRKVISWARPGNWDLDHLHEVLQRGRPAVAYLIPDFHNPTGRLATDEERNLLAAQNPRVPWLVVDETLRGLDLRSSGTPMPAHLAAIIPAAITIGGLSKTVWSGLRLGWLRVTDPGLRTHLSRFTDVQPVPVLDQLIALEIWPHLNQIIGERNTRLRRQRDTLVTEARSRGFAVEQPQGGLACWVDLQYPIASTLARRLARRGVLVATGRTFSTTHDFERFLRIPFTHAPVTITKAVNLIASEAMALSWQTAPAHGW